MSIRQTLRMTLVSIRTTSMSRTTKSIRMNPTKARTVIRRKSRCRQQKWKKTERMKKQKLNILMILKMTRKKRWDIAINNIVKRCDRWRLLYFVIRGGALFMSFYVAKKKTMAGFIDLVTVFDAILTSRQTCEKLQCLYENLMSNNFRKTAVLKKISIVN